MSFKAKFTVDGKDYRVFNCSYSLQQDVDKTGRPSSEVRGGSLQAQKRNYHFLQTRQRTKDERSEFQGRVHRFLYRVVHQSRR